MTVRIDDEDALDKFLNVECADCSDRHREAMRELHSDAARNPHGFKAFLEAYRAIPPDKRRPDHPVKVKDGMIALSGDQAHRFFVRETGEVYFSERHAVPAVVARAEAEGFDIQRE